MRTRRRDEASLSKTNIVDPHYVQLTIFDCHKQSLHLDCDDDRGRTREMRCSHFSSKTPKTQNPIIQKRSILALFRLPYIGQYVPFSAMELKSSFLRGPAHKIEKRPFFAKKREVEENQKGFEDSTCFAIIISSLTRASDPPRALQPSLCLWL